MSKFVPPAVTSSSFTCPHCEVLTTQFWHAAYGESAGASRLPTIWDANQVTTYFSTRSEPNKTEALAKKLQTLVAGHAMVFERSSVQAYVIRNLNVSSCYECGKVALWIGAEMVWPSVTSAPQPNADLPESILADYREAAGILHSSPRGAAALLRLCVQKLCKHLGEPGDNINQDIASLVKKGLDPAIQMALDSVRVVGNEAVHPGQMDLSDDVVTASELFMLVNIVADTMISNKKRIAAIYAALPADKREQIEARDKSAKS